MAKLSRRSFVLPALAFVASACAPPVSTRPPPAAPPAPLAAAPSDAMAATTTDEAAAALAALVLDVAHALVAAVRGEAHDARFDCDGAPHLRDTSEVVVERFAALAAPADGPGAAAVEPPELVVAGLDGIRVDTRASGAWPKGAPHDEGDYAPPEEQPTERWLELRADAAAFPDGRLRWAGIRTSFTAEPPPGVEEERRSQVAGGAPHAGERREPGAGRASSGTQLVPLKQLPREVGGALEELLGRLSDPACAPDVLRESDLGSFDGGSELRRRAESAVARATRRVPQACKDIEEATGPWLVRLVDADAVVRVRSGVPVEIRASAHVDTGRVCIGPAVVRVVGEGQP